MLQAPGSRVGAAFLRSLVGAIVLFANLEASLRGAGTDARPKYILFLTADGFRTDYVDWYPAPNLRQLISEGVRVADVKCAFPTVTTPNMTSLATGAYPRTTGVAVNTQYVREEDKIVKAPRTTVETIAGTLRKAGWVTGAVNHFVLEKAVDHYVAPGYADSAKTTDAIIDLLENKHARFVGAIFGATDQAGHRYGPQTDQVRDAVVGIDQAIGRLIAYLKQRGIYEETLISFNADHGMSAFDAKQASIEPAQALADAGFRVSRTDSDLNAQTQIVVIDAGVRVVYFRDVPQEVERQRAIAVLRKIDGVDILEHKDLAALGCHDNRSGDVIVSPKPGVTMSGAGKGGGLHGRFAEQNPILIFRGPGFRTNAVVTTARTIDVVPTLLKLAGVAPAKTVDGTVIAEALR